MIAEAEVEVAASALEGSLWRTRLCYLRKMALQVRSGTGAYSICRKTSTSPADTLLRTDMLAGSIPSTSKPKRCQLMESTSFFAIGGERAMLP